MDLALKVLDIGGLSITRLLMHRLGSAETSHFKNAFLSEGGGLEKSLKELVERYPAAGDRISRAVGLGHTLKKVSAEMDLVKTHTLLSSTEVTPHSMRDWTIGIPEHLAPCLSSILRASAVSDRAVKENKVKIDTFTVSLTSLGRKTKLTRPQIVNVIIHQLVNFRSQNSQRFQVPFGLSLLAHGTPRAVVDILNKLHLSPCFDTISSTAVTLADGCITEATSVAKGPHVLAYDNIQASTSPLIEQREGAPAKVQSGTVSVIYPALNANLTDMALSKIRENWCRTEGLSYAHDIRQTREQLESHFEQLVIHTVRVLHHLKGSKDITNHRDFQHPERRKLPAGHATKQFPLRASHFEEASVQGNIAVVNNIYVSQLQMLETDFDNRAIPCINDQLTNARLRTAQLSRTSDDNAFTRLEFLQLGFGLFHAHMNLIWAVLSIHRGSFETVGSLAYFFNILDLRRLGSA